MKTHRLLAVAFVFGSVAVAACDKPQDTPTPTPATATASTTSKPAATPSPSPAPSPTAPNPTTMPEDASNGGPAGNPPVPSGSASAAPGGPLIELVPKTSFGPIKLGATKKEIEALGLLTVHPQYSGMTIPYTVYYDAAGKAKRIQLTLKHAPADVKVGTLTIPRTATMADVKSLLGDCKDEPPATGGTTSKCRGGTVNVSIGSGSPAEVWLEAALP